MPVLIKNEVVKYDKWQSLCGRYWIARVSPTYGFNPYYTWGTTEAHTQHGGGVKYHDSFGSVKTQDYRPTQYRDIFRCLEKIKEDFENKHQMTCEMDDSIFLSIAKDKGLDKLPPKIEIKGPTVENKLQVFDRFGSVEGTDKASFNKALSRKWRTFIRLKRRARVKTRMRRHLMKLVAKGYVRESNGRFRLSKKYG